MFWLNVEGCRAALKSSGIWSVVDFRKDASTMVYSVSVRQIFLSCRAQTLTKTNTTQKRAKKSRTYRNKKMAMLAHCGAVANDRAAVQMANLRDVCRRRKGQAPVPGGRAAASCQDEQSKR